MKLTRKQIFKANGRKESSEPTTFYYVGEKPTITDMLVKDTLEPLPKVGTRVFCSGRPCLIIQQTNTVYL